MLLEDTRQQKGKHEIKHAWWQANGYGLIRSKLAFGDYCLPPKAAVDTKASIYELAYDRDHDHKRFRDGLIRARDAGVRLYIVVENDEGVRDLQDLRQWREDAAHFAERIHARRRLEGTRLAKACVTLSDRYGPVFLFCAPEESAALVSQLLEEGGRQ